MWKCVSIVSLNLFSNSGSVEICPHCLNLSIITLEVWKCGNVEICLHCLILSNNSGSVEMWKCGNMSFLSLSNNSGSVEMWKYVFNAFV